MADEKTLSAQALVRKVLSDEHADLISEAVAFVCQEIMEAEVSAQVGEPAEFGGRVDSVLTPKRPALPTIGQETIEAGPDPHSDAGVRSNSVIHSAWREGRIAACLWDWRSRVVVRALPEH